MARMLDSLVRKLVITDNTPRLLAGTGNDQTVLLFVLTSDRGLCGAFNASIVRETRRTIRRLETEGKTVKLFCVGRKGRDALRRDHAGKILHAVEDIGRKRVAFEDADKIGAKLVALYEAGQFDVCHILFNRFQSVIAQVVTVKQLIPFVSLASDSKAANENTASDATDIHPVCDFEPEEETILETLLPRALAVAIFGTLLESAAGEQGARMTAMDNATRNAGDMIDNLTMTYNRSRQASITKELIEIISGAEAV
jgi:F-type H+-transporting ATPase subunit gamma